MPVAPTLSGSFEAVRVLSGGFSGQQSICHGGKGVFTQHRYRTRRAIESQRFGERQLSASSARNVIRLVTLKEMGDGGGERG